MDERYRNTSKIWDQITEQHQSPLDLDIFDESLEFLIQSCQNQNPSILDLGIRPVNMSKYLCLKSASARLSVSDFSYGMDSLLERNVTEHKKDQIPFNQLSRFEDEFDIIVNSFGIPYLDEEDISQFISRSYSALCAHGLLYLTYQDKADLNHKKELDLLRQDQLYYKDFIFNLVDRVGFRRLKNFQVIHTSNEKLISKYEVLIARKLDIENEHYKHEK